VVTTERSTLETLHILGSAGAFIENKVDDADAWLKRRIELPVLRIAGIIDVRNGYTFVSK